MDKDAFFREHYEEFKALVDKRRSKWRATSIMEWEDVHSHLLTHIFRRLDQYDEDRPLDRWVNTVITNEIMNLLRNLIWKTARPCIAANSYGSPCVFNTGGTGCSKTPSKTQCGECKFFAKWERRKQAKFAIAAPLSIEHHTDESHSMQDDFLDIEAAKKVIDDNIQRRLTKEEYRIYVFLYVKHLSMEETVQKMGFKKTDANDMKGYMRVRSAAILAKEVAKQIISENSLVR